MTRYPQHFCEIICDVTNHACRTTCENLIPNEHRENFTLFFDTENVFYIHRTNTVHVMLHSEVQSFNWKNKKNTFLTGGLTVKVEVRLELSVQLSVKLQPTWPSLPLTPPTQFTFMHCQCLISEIRKHTGKLALHDQTIAVSYLATRRKMIRVIIIITF